MNIIPVTCRGALDLISTFLFLWAFEWIFLLIKGNAEKTERVGMFLLVVGNSVDDTTVH